eukprot:Blabericola_migrator_1__7690@NODE_3925_length_1423_cov_75_496313_g2428_i0_p1_GENE_NODE_3925_length_1423_cov_75_496313_g2428_i0NODE_3925_length_1423_cov_75_496313_g2428_i0_p1_ORF_typecomplete_len150_score9_31LGT/PF01790_18/0_14_NODE_3925_length_1423_cov_75_496313_g2428_i06771126
MFWCAILGPQLWLVVIKLTNVACPVLRHLPIWKRLSCKVLGVLIGGIAINLGALVASRAGCKNVDWSAFLIMPSVMIPTGAPLSTLSIAVAWLSAAVFCSLWLQATNKKSSATPMAAILPVTVTQDRSVQALWREVEDFRAHLKVSDNL